MLGRSRSVDVHRPPGGPLKSVTNLSGAEQMLKNAIRIALGLAALGLAAGPAQAADVEVKTKGGFEVKAGDFSAKLGGRIMLDYVLPSEDVALLGSNLFFRRARIELEGKMFKTWEYKAEYDFAENSVAAKDLYIAYTGFEGSEILIGQYKQFFSLEELTSSKGIAFMERSLPNAFVRAHSAGLGYRTWGDNYSLMASVYGQEAGVANTGNEDEDIGYVGRLVFAPIKSDDSLLHIGLAYASESVTGAGGGPGTIRHRQRPEARPSNGGVRLVDTGNITSDGQTKLGLEFAWMSGGLSVQGEYISVDVDAPAVGDPTFSGYYAQVSWFPTGEVRPYSMKNGSFSMIKPLNLDGAWELRARLSSIDLEDGTVLGGVEDNIGVGVTFYPNSNMRFMLEYITADVDDRATVGGPVTTDSPSFIQARAQISW
jgi:phosphate-selective porin OprO/OprP